MNVNPRDVHAISQELTKIRKVLEAQYKLDLQVAQTKLGYEIQQTYPYEALGGEPREKEEGDGLYEPRASDTG